MRFLFTYPDRIVITAIIFVKDLSCRTNAIILGVPLLFNGLISSGRSHLFLHG